MLTVSFVIVNCLRVIGILEMICFSKRVPLSLDFTVHKYLQYYIYSHTLHTVVQTVHYSKVTTVVMYPRVQPITTDHP